MRKLSTSLLLLILLTMVGTVLKAQVSNTLYFMHGVPQANQVNPAFRPTENFYIGIPLISPARLNFSSSALAYGDVIYPNPGEDSLITFMHPLGDKEAFLKELKSLNFLSGGLQTSLFSMGFNTGAGFFTLGLSTRMEANLYYPGDLARLALFGAEEGRTYSLDGIGVDVTAFDEISLGWSRNLMDQLRLGVRAKVLFGVSDMSTIKSDLQVQTGQEQWNVQSDFQMNVSLPFAEVTYGEDGLIEDVELKGNLDNPGFSEMKAYMFNTQNMGFGVDIGLDYRPVDKLQLSLSVLDLAFIKWKDEVHQMDYVLDYDYVGIELNPLELSEDYGFNEHLDSTLNQMADSLIGFLSMHPAEAYSKMLNTKLFVGLSFYATEKINFGLLSRTDFLNGRIAEQVTATANLTTGRFLNFTVSYSYMNAYWKNIGAGISFNAGPLNLYLISDNALNGVLWPQEARSMNLWFGMNLVFGYKEKTDLPLVF